MTNHRSKNSQLEHLLSKAISFCYILVIWICAAICAIPIIPNTQLDVVELSPGKTDQKLKFEVQDHIFENLLLLVCQASKRVP